MIRVRFDTGLVLQYNQANYIDREVSGISRLRNKEGGHLIASIPHGCVVEFCEPCRVYSDTGHNEELAASERALSRAKATIQRLRAPKARRKP